MSSPTDAQAVSSVVAVATTSHPVESNTRIQKVSNIEELEAILAESSKRVVLIEFFAEWCGPCKIIANKLEEWAQIYDVTILKIDVDELEDVAIEYNVGSVPNFVVLKDKQKLEQFEGSHEDKIIMALEKYCPKFDNRRQATRTPPESMATRQLPRVASDIAVETVVEKRRDN